MINKQTEEIKLSDRKLYLKPEIFKNDALILDCSKLSNREVVLKCSTSSRKVKVRFEDFDYLGIWTHPFYTNYVCIEPWSALPDCNFIDKKLENKIGIRKLTAKNMTCWSILLMAVMIDNLLRKLKRQRV